MKKILITTIIIFIGFYAVNAQEDKWSINVDASYIVNPFNRFNLVEEGDGYFPIERKSGPAYRIGLGINRQFRNHRVGVSLGYLAASFEMKYDLRIPYIVNDEVFSVTERTLSINYNNSRYLGLNYQYAMNKLSLGIGLNLMAFDYTPNNIPDYNSNARGYIRKIYYQGEQIGEYDINTEEFFQFGEFKGIQLVPELSVAYELLPNLNIQASILLKVWGNKEAYTLKTVGTGDFVEELPEDNTFTDLRFKNRLVAPTIGLNYNLGFSKLKFWK